MSEIEHRAAVEFRFDGRQLSGPAVRYGDVAVGAKGPERMEAAVFVSGLDTASLVLQHDRSRVLASQPEALVLTDGPAALHLRAEFGAGSAEATLVRRRTLTGLSVGFVALEERRDGGLRVISRAHLDHVALVDRPAYPGSTVELRQAFEDAFLTAEISYGRRMQCTCQGGGCDSVSFEPGAFGETLRQRRELLAIGGQGFASVLGSLRRKTLLVEETRDGLRIGLTNPNTEAARQVIEAASVAPVLARPIIDVDASEYRDEGTVRRFSTAAVTAILVKASPNDEGHIPVKVRGIEERSRRTRRIWL